jgi:exonuclease III
MIVGSFNIRGLGSRIKRRKVRDLVRVERLDFLALQETKLQSVCDSLPRSLWGNEDCDWAFLPADGNSGGILSIWRKSLLSHIFTFVGSGFVGVCLETLQTGTRFCVVNVYSKCSLMDKRNLWGGLLMSKRGFGGCSWCIVGDFNSVREMNERRGVGSNLVGGMSQEVIEFGEFLEALELVDMPLIGRRFTWFHPNGTTMSRLDRVLLSHDWGIRWGNPHVWALHRDVSDHCPLIVRYSASDWGPKPFRFNNFWLQNKRFKDLVAKTWQEQSFEGWMGFILKDRLKDLKGVIKNWCVEEYGKPEEKKKLLLEKILVLDARSEDVGLSEGEVGERKRLFGELWATLKSIDSLAFQRSRAKWLREGDTNSRYFHCCINSRRRSNNIIVLRTAEGWVEGPTHVKEATVTFFRGHFDNSIWNRPKLQGVVFPVLSRMEASSLETIFSSVEIEEAVKTSDGSKCPGPDGFNYAFIKEFWGLMRSEVRILFDQFHGNECIPKCLMSYFLTLVPKVKSPQCLRDFRPISLLGCFYKLIAKVLAARLAKVLDPLISKSQTAFLKGQQLVEGVVVVNEVIDYAKKSGKECMILKVDFEKAYDSVDWKFLDYVL